MIPYIHEFDFAYGEASWISGNVRRLVANNPGPFTGWGTNVYFIGRSELIIIDPGPDTDEHFALLCKIIGDCPLRAVLVTHHHRDHSPMAPRLADHFGCKTIGFGPPLVCAADNGFEEADHTGFSPDIRIRDGQVFDYEEVSIECIHTPGHTSNHMCYAVFPDNGLVCGDHVLSWATSVVIPPDGRMGEYLDSLELVKQRSFCRLWPGHGPEIPNPEPFLTAYLAHRAMRDAQIMQQLACGPQKISQMVPVIYAQTDKKLYPAASVSMLAHLIHLRETGHVACIDEPALSSLWYLPN